MKETHMQCVSRGDGSPVTPAPQKGKARAVRKDRRGACVRAAEWGSQTAERLNKARRVSHTGAGGERTEQREAEARCHRAAWGQGMTGEKRDEAEEATGPAVVSV